MAGLPTVDILGNLLAFFNSWPWQLKWLALWAFFYADWQYVGGFTHQAFGVENAEITTFILTIIPLNPVLNAIFGFTITAFWLFLLMSLFGVYKVAVFAGVLKKLG